MSDDLLMTKSLAVVILEAKAEHDAAVDAIGKALNGADLGPLYLDIIDAIADHLGFPEDNVSAFAYEEYASGQDWPKEAYCRDWLYNAWDDARNDDKPDATIDAFVDDMAEHGKRDWSHLRSIYE